jgi:hypothetical protein
MCTTSLSVITVWLWVFMYDCDLLCTCCIHLWHHLRLFLCFAYQPKPVVPPPAAPGSRGTGRADLLARFCARQREAQAAPPVAKVGEDKPVHVGRGYGLLKLKSESP